ncbi:MAG: hypothetical protein PHH22_02630 [Clostridia bacterium]|nr:hypothetical protein [Clostridia bacterium]
MSYDELFEAKMKLDAEIDVAEEMRKKIVEQMDALDLAEECYKRICEIVLKKGFAIYNLADSNLIDVCRGAQISKYDVAKALKQKIVASETITFGCNPKIVSPDYMFNEFARIRIVPKTQ